MHPIATPLHLHEVASHPNSELFPRLGETFAAAPPFPSSGVILGLKLLLPLPLKGSEPNISQLVGHHPPVWEALANRVETFSQSRCGFPTPNPGYLRKIL